MTIIEMVEQYLKQNGYDGLFAESAECACKVDDLEPCGNIQSDCHAGYLAPGDCGEHDWHIQEKKP